jgi:hypothetical protein
MNAFTTPAKAVFGGRGMDVPYAINGKRVLASFPREDESGYVLVLNLGATMGDPRGNNSPDDHFVAVYSKASTRLSVLEADLSWLPAIERAVTAAYENEN